jgi:hypothetical protein
MDTTMTKMERQAGIDAIIRFAVSSDAHHDSSCDAVRLACAMLLSSDDDVRSGPAESAGKPQPSKRKPEFSLT